SAITSAASHAARSALADRNRIAAAHTTILTEGGSLPAWQILAPADFRGDYRPTCPNDRAHGTNKGTGETLATQDNEFPHSAQA
ncbi:hypothetical protein, partial [Wenzhouxiangella sp. EGI_FJ10409]|uniref:hypothetical protein n=1 Tax=Wenzhouxiangella sp. EGI_FJ10409 TaxID=3243767 RepID=UPI0035DF5749